MSIDAAGNEVNTIPVDAPESVTQELEDAFYAPEKVEEIKPEQTTVVSEDPIKDEVTETKEVNAEENPEKLEKEAEKADDDKNEESEISYDLKLAEESHLDAKAIEEVTAFATENKLSNEAAQAMLKREEEMLTNFVQSNEAALDAQVNQWRESIVADKVLGGENLETTKANSRRAVERFGSEGFIEILNTTGYGNHPEVVGFLNKLGSLMSEDSLISGKAEPAAQKELHEYFYN